MAACRVVLCHTTKNAHQKLNTIEKKFYICAVVCVIFVWPYWTLLRFLVCDVQQLGQSFGLRLGTFFISRINFSYSCPLCFFPTTQLIPDTPKRKVYFLLLPMCTVATAVKSMFQGSVHLRQLPQFFIIRILAAHKGQNTTIWSSCSMALRPIFNTWPAIFIVANYVTSHTLLQSFKAMALLRSKDHRLVLASTILVPIKLKFKFLVIFYIYQRIYWSLQYCSQQQ